MRALMKDIKAIFRSKWSDVLKSLTRNSNLLLSEFFVLNFAIESITSLFLAVSFLHAKEKNPLLVAIWRQKANKCQYSEDSFRPIDVFNPSRNFCEIETQGDLIYTISNIHNSFQSSLSSVLE
jgi:hypothetical protein